MHKKVSGYSAFHHYNRGWIAQEERVSGVRQVAQGGGAESSCVESPEPSLLRGVDVDSRTGLDPGVIIMKCRVIILVP